MRRSTIGSQKTVNYRKSIEIANSNMFASGLNDWNARLKGIGNFQPCTLLKPLNSEARDKFTEVKVNGGKIYWGEPTVNVNEAWFDTGIRFEGDFELIIGTNFISKVGLGSNIKFVFTNRNGAIFTTIIIIYTGNLGGAEMKMYKKGVDVLGGGASSASWLKFYSTPSDVNTQVSWDKVSWSSRITNDTDRSTTWYFNIVFYHTTTDYTIYSIGDLEVTKGCVYSEW